MAERRRRDRQPGRSRTSPTAASASSRHRRSLPDPVVALQGSGTADAPHIVLNLDTTGRANVSVAYILRDIDGTIDNAVQPVALQYPRRRRAALDQPSRRVRRRRDDGPEPRDAGHAGERRPPGRRRTTSRSSRSGSSRPTPSANDEWVGIDDISVTASAVDLAPAVAVDHAGRRRDDVAVGSNISVTFSEPVDVTGGSFTITCDDVRRPHRRRLRRPRRSRSTPTWTSPSARLHRDRRRRERDRSGRERSARRHGGRPRLHVHDGRGAAAAPGEVVISEVYGGGGNAGATLTNDFIELYNRTGAPISLAGWSVQYASAAGTTWQVTPLTGSIPAGRNYLVQEAAGAGGTVDLPAPDATGTIADEWHGGQGRARLERDRPDRRLPDGRDDQSTSSATGRRPTAPKAAADRRHLSNTTAALAQRRRRDRHRTTTPPTSPSAPPDPHAVRRTGADRRRRRRRRTARPASRSPPIITITFSEPVNVAGSLVHRSPARRAAPTTPARQRRSDDASPSTRPPTSPRTSRARSRSWPPAVTDQDARRPAGHDGGELRVHLPDRGRR